jgi:hypothetical protein
MTTNRVLGLVALAVVFPALAAAQDTSYDYDRTAPFAQYRTYALKEGTSTDDPLNDARIAAALDRELAFRGLRKVEASPDVYVSFSMAYEKQKDIQYYSMGPWWGGGYGWGYGGWGWGYGGWGWGPTTDVYVREILVGTLTIDIVDAKRERLAWRGLGVKRVDTDEDADDRDKHVRKAVSKIMRNYPPGADDDD